MNESSTILSLKDGTDIPFSIQLNSLGDRYILVFNSTYIYFSSNDLEPNQTYVFKWHYDSENESLTVDICNDSMTSIWETVRQCQIPSSFTGSTIISNDGNAADLLFINLIYHDDDNTQYWVQSSPDGVYELTRGTAYQISDIQ